jgi:hypothetical protein
MQWQASQQRRASRTNCSSACKQPRTNSWSSLSRSCSRAAVLKLLQPQQLARRSAQSAQRRTASRALLQHLLCLRPGRRNGAVAHLAVYRSVPEGSGKCSCPLLASTRFAIPAAPSSFLGRRLYCGQQASGSIRQPLHPRQTRLALMHVWPPCKLRSSPRRPQHSTGAELGSLLSRLQSLVPRILWRVLGRHAQAHEKLKVTDACMGVFT